MAKKAKLHGSVKIKSSARKPMAKQPASFLERAGASFPTELAGTVHLPRFRQTAGHLTKTDRLTLIDQALILLEQNYVHLRLKESMHGIDPLQRLKLLQHQVRITPDDQMPDEQVFHREMASIFHSMRDLHTNYLLPDPYNRMTAFLPFLVEDYFEDGERCYVVSQVFRGFDEPPFEVGVEVLRWNGVPIDRAIEINGDRFAGSNPEARRARGIATMTVRSLIMSLPPDEDRVVVDYRTEDGKTHELRVDWLVFSPDAGMATARDELPTEVAAAQGVDIELDVCRQARKVLFAPKVVALEKKLAARAGELPMRGLGLQSIMPSVLEARPVDTPSGTFGYLRIRTFSVPNANVFVDEVVRLIEQLPKNGLIIDVRGNGGGLIFAGEQLLQLFTPGEVQPEPVQFINTELNLKLCERHSFLSQWSDSIRQSIRTGAVYSRSFPITPPEEANNVGQRYHGPVVVVTDALCYSTTDIFAAGFQDQVSNGTILGVDNNTGAGGANVWTHDLLQFIFPPSEPGSPYRHLPNGSGMRVAVRRTLRVGDMAGTPVEDLGVIPDMRHNMTRNDVLNGNVELIDRAGEILAQMPARVLDADLLTNDGGGLGLNLKTQGISRVDVFADSRPLGSVDVSNGDIELDLGIDSADVLEMRGFFDNKLVASLRLGT